MELKTLIGSLWVSAFVVLSGFIIADYHAGPYQKIPLSSSYENEHKTYTREESDLKRERPLTKEDALVHVFPLLANTAKKHLAVPDITMNVKKVEQPVPEQNSEHYAKKCSILAHKKFYIAHLKVKQRRKRLSAARALKAHRTLHFEPDKKKSSLILEKGKPLVPGAPIKPVAADATWRKLRQEPLFSWPIDPSLFWVSSQYGPRKKPSGRSGFHKGVDLAAMKGTPVRAAGEGTVVEAGYSLGYGNYITIGHEGAFKTRYAHLDKILVQVGQSVTVGDHIGRVGATGFVRKSKWGGSGSHLHFEVYMNGKAVNPFYFLA